MSDQFITKTKGPSRHPKGTRFPLTIKRAEDFRRGIPIECKHHGFHLAWRRNARDSIRCKICDSEDQRKRATERTLHILVKRARHDHRGHACEIDETYLETILVSQENRCALTGISFSEECRPSLDRIDPSKGYVHGNVQLVTREINRIKQHYQQDEFIHWCSLVVEQAKIKAKKE